MNMHVAIELHGEQIARLFLTKSAAEKYVEDRAKVDFESRSDSCRSLNLEDYRSEWYVFPVADERTRD